MPTVTLYALQAADGSLRWIDYGGELSANRDQRRLWSSEARAGRWKAIGEQTHQVCLAVIPVTTDQPDDPR